MSNTRLQNAILGPNSAYAQATQAPMLNLEVGGQQGPMTDFTGYVSNSAYVRRNVICLLVAAPRGFRDLDNPEIWEQTLKSLVELHAKSIEGLNSTLTVEHVENAVGGAGEMQQDLSNVTRARSTPTFVWTEKYGQPVRAFLEGWVTQLMMDPITKGPAILSTGRRPSDLLPDYTGATMLFFEPDPTFTKVTKAWLCTNMRPTNQIAENTGRRDLTQAGESVDYTVEFTSLTQVGAKVTEFAQSRLDAMNLTGLNPNLQNAFVTAIDPYVSGADNGYTEQLSNEATSGNTM
ncbi:hypothetical protein LUCX_27 [Xanthomonas phage vB_XciM_LucasX]|nr:hypothetical protein LUCX_27 [Xanthomonas phage vB_XciM_LucasX]